MQKKIHSIPGILSYFSVCVLWGGGGLAEEY